jgi:hypothetical protein
MTGSIVRLCVEVARHNPIFDLVIGKFSQLEQHFLDVVGPAGFVFFPLFSFEVRPDDDKVLLFIPCHACKR